MLTWRGWVLSGSGVRVWLLMMPQPQQLPVVWLPQPSPRPRRSSSLLPTKVNRCCSCLLDEWMARGFHVHFVWLSVTVAFGCCSRVLSMGATLLDSSTASAAVSAVGGGGSVVGGGGGGGGAVGGGGGGGPPAPTIGGCLALVPAVAPYVFETPQQLRSVLVCCLYVMGRTQGNHQATTRPYMRGRCHVGTNVEWRQDDNQSHACVSTKRDGDAPRPPTG